MNLRSALEALEEISGERIEAMVVGKHYTTERGQEALADENVVLSRDAGLAKVDEEYDNGYGGADCFPLYAWTASRVYLVHEYDGATGLVYVPRNPCDIEPEFGGNDPAMEAWLEAAQKASKAANP